MSWRPPESDRVNTDWRPPESNAVASPESPPQPQDMRRWDQKLSDFVTSSPSINSAVQQVASQPEFQPFENGVPEISDVIDTQNPSALGQLAGTARKLVSLPSRFSQTLGAASDPVTDTINEYLGRKQVNPTVSALAAMVGGAAVDPRNYISLGGVSTDQPSVLPDSVAQAREARTGVPARQFKRLYNDPGAIFAGGNKAQAGVDLGAAKVAAGIDLGVTSDPASLTPENIDRIKPTASIRADDIDAVTQHIRTQQLPVIEPNSKVGDPHALYVYPDEFGPNGNRLMYNIYGDPNNPTIKAHGYGSSLPEEALKKSGIPITGKVPNAIINPLAPQTAQNALDSVNSIMSQPSVQNDANVLRKWTIVKQHINNALGGVAPDVATANQNFAREALGDDFSGMNALNKNGTPSKLGLLARSGAAAVGGIAGHLIPGLNSPEGMFVGYKTGQLLNQAYHAPFIAGLQTSAEAYANRLLNPAISSAQKTVTSPAALALVARYLAQRNQQNQE